MSQPAPTQQLAVALQRARVGVEVLVRRELQPVHEDARHHRARRAARPSHQRQVALVQVAHGGHEGRACGAGQRAAQVGDGVDDLHGCGPVSSRARRGRGSCRPSRRRHSCARAASMLSAPAMKLRTKRGSLPRVMPSMSCSTSTWPLQPGPAPMPMTGMGRPAASCCASARGHQLDHQHRGAGLGQLARVAQQRRRAVFVAALDAVAAQRMHRLRRQPEVGAHRDAALDEEAHRLGRPAATFELDHLRAGLHQRGRAAQRLLGRVW